MQKNKYSVSCLFNLFLDVLNSSKYAASDMENVNYSHIP